MNRPQILLAITMLLLATIACQAVMGGSQEMDTDPVPATESLIQPQDSESTEMPAEAGSTSDSKSTVNTQFPMTADAFNVVEVEDGSLIYYTKLSTEEAMQFYREEYTSQGYAEREDLTVVLDGMFSLVFDGDPGGKSVVIQSVDLGDGSRTITIRLEDV